jgi:hypothetical protein
MPETLTSRQRAASTRPRSAPRAGACTICSKVELAPAERRNLERAGASFPDQNLEPRARFGVVRKRQLLTVTDQRRARERIAERSFEHTPAGYRSHALAQLGLFGSQRQNWRQLNVTSPRAGVTPQQQDRRARRRERFAERADVSIRLRQLA